MGCLSRVAGTLAALALALAVVLPAQADSFATAQAEQEERLASSKTVLEQWGDIGGADPLVLGDMAMLVEASLAWLDTLEPETCWRPWWAQSRATWELMRLAVVTDPINPTGAQWALNGFGASRHIAENMAETACTEEEV